MSDAHILDASAVLCLVLDEPGSDVVERRLSTAAISSVNLCEVVTKLFDKSLPRDSVDAILDNFNFRIEPFSAELALEAARLRVPTRSAGLSLADRACLATARQCGATAVTADRAWAAIDPSVDVQIELIR